VSVCKPPQTAMGLLWSELPVAPLVSPRFDSELVGVLDFDAAILLVCIFVVAKCGRTLFTEADG